MLFTPLTDKHLLNTESAFSYIPSVISIQFTYAHSSSLDTISPCIPHFYTCTYIYILLFTYHYFSTCTHSQNTIICTYLVTSELAPISNTCIYIHTLIIPLYTFLHTTSFTHKNVFYCSYVFVYFNTYHCIIAATQISCVVHTLFLCNI